MWPWVALGRHRQAGNPGSGRFRPCPAQEVPQLGPAPPLLRPGPSQSLPPPAVTEAPSRWRQRPADERGPRLTMTLPAARTWVRARQCRGGDAPWDGGWEGAAASAWGPRGAGSRPWLRHPEGFPCGGRVEWGAASSQEHRGRRGGSQHLCCLPFCSPCTEAAPRPTGGPGRERRVGRKGRARWGPGPMEGTQQGTWGSQEEDPPAGAVAKETAVGPRNN